MQRFSSVLDREDHAEAAGVLCEVARFVALGRGDAMQSLALAQAERASELALRYIKSAAGSLSDPTWGGALDGRAEVISAFVESLRSKSVFARLLADGMTRLPLKTRAAIVTANATAWATGEGMPISVSAMSLAGSALEERKAAALIVLSNELIRSTSPAARALLDASLKSAVADAIDASFLDIVTDGLTPIAATGTTPAAALTDLRTLLGLVNTTGAGSLYFLMGADVANRAATLAGSDSTLTFPAMGPLGGEMLNTPALVSSAMLSGQIALLDATGIAGEIEAVTVSLSDQASIEMDSAPSSPPNAATVLRSLWQENKVAILARAYFGAEVIRAGSIAALDGIAWGAAP
ncbi:phage major capsid family protein [Bosea sp. LjRoot237]|uniref:phage major capsid family protein n=1 Tax=Bosea sp. LjRoot237 TaxID=3342292 RepID=UPI003ED0839C